MHYSRSSKDFADVHGLVMHAYNPPNADSLVDHLGLHKALCVLMGWDYTKVPENSKGYQSLPSDLVQASREDLIVWPPTVIFHNTSTGRKKDGRLEGLGNKEMDKKMTGIFLSQPLSYAVFAYKCRWHIYALLYSIQCIFINTLSQFAYCCYAKSGFCCFFVPCWVVKLLFLC